MPQRMPQLLALDAPDCTGKCFDFHAETLLLDKARSELKMLKKPALIATELHLHYYCDQARFFNFYA